MLLKKNNTDLYYIFAKLAKLPSKIPVKRLKQQFSVVTKLQSKSLANNLELDDLTMYDLY